MIFWELFFKFGSSVLLIGVFISLWFIIKKINKDIKQMDKKRRSSLIDYIRRTSKHKETKKRLKF